MTLAVLVECVYLQSEYPEEPHYIGRVMEFVYVPRVRQPKPLLSMTGDTRQRADDSSEHRESTPTPTPDAAAAQLRVRLAWYQRPRDLPITRVRAKDMRLLVATMHTDINPVSAIRGKCFVRHVSEIPDLNAWKAQTDHYYYSQLFDRYSTRLYDIIPVSQIRNAPQEVLQKLRDTYEFIFAETQKITDLTSTRRACTVCAKWCSISESVKCSLCEKHYHLQCLDPPPARKPAKGYGWQCAACIRRMQQQRTQSSEEIANDSASSAASIGATTDVGDRKRVTRNMVAEESFSALRSSSTVHTPGATPGAAATSDTESRPGSKRLKLSHGDSRLYGDRAAGPIPRPKNRGLWPFRYFGINTDIDDVLHDDERIYPRAVSRIGPKYQAIIPDMVSPAGPELDKQLTEAYAELQKANKGAGGISAVRGSMHSAAPGLTSGRAANGHGTAAGSSSSHRWGRENAGIGGGGGGTSRWYGKNAEQMGRAWDEIELRRGNHDEQLFFKQPKTLPNDELDMYMEAILPFLQRHFAQIQDFTLLDCQDAALHGLALHNYDVEETLISIPDCPEGYIRQRASGDFWAPATLAQFNDSMRELGSNLQLIHENIPTITRRAVTLHYYLVRPTALGKQLLEAYDNRSHTGLRRSMLGQGESAVNAHLEVASDVGASAANTPGSSPRISGMATREQPGLRCINCLSDHSTKWTPAPLEFVSHNTRSGKSSGARRVVCDECRDHWQHYATMPDQDAINARKSHLYAQGTNTRNGQTRVRAAQTPVLPKVRAVEPWPLIPCDLCRQATGDGSDAVALVCRDCGLCVHYGCSGYPDGAVVNPRRWKCGVCTNSTNPTVSINYACILCGKEPAHAGSRVRQLMWRTKGNNWVHPLCALAAPEATLTYSHGNVIVTGTTGIAADAWMRNCAVCRRSDGAAPKCIDSACQRGIHATCARLFASSGGLAADPHAILALRPTGGQPGAPGLLDEMYGFTAGGGAVAVVLKCADHARAGSQDVEPTAQDRLGRSVIEAAIACKAVKPSPASRGAMLQSSVSQMQHTRPTTPASAKDSATSDVKPKLPSPSPSPPPSSSSLAAMSNPNMVAWASAADDPMCAQCAAAFSPIWWPVSPGAVPDKSAEVKVLCHRCHSSVGSQVPGRVNGA
ncbi:putative PHD type zinc finger protein with BAH domain-containing protein [Coemansia sp. Cherry 401B]|nr:putative PHD type zinc finger protein with BAH domain-containing protein [Coemansia sp. Cherry 401B]